MLSHISTLSKATLYYVLALGLAVVIAYFMASFPKLEEYLGPADIYMLTPVISVLLMLFVLTRDGYTKAGLQSLGMHRLGLRTWPFAILAPVILFTLVYGLAWLFGIGRFDFTQTPPVGKILSLLVLQIIFSTTEEIGWRGYLLPHLLPLGRTRALLLSGFCHGLWHLPVMLMTPFYHEDGNRVIVVTLFLLTLTAAGVLYGYVRLAGDSLWPAVLVHAMVNTTWTFWLTVTVAVGSVESLEYWAGESGIFSVILITLTAAWLLYRINRRAQPTPIDSLATVTQ